MPTYDVISKHGRLLDSTDDLTQAERWLGLWHSAKFVVEDRKKVVRERGELDCPVDTPITTITGGPQSE